MGSSTPATRTLRRTKRNPLCWSVGSVGSLGLSESKVSCTSQCDRYGVLSPNSVDRLGLTTGFHPLPDARMAHVGPRHQRWVNVRFELTVHFPVAVNAVPRGRYRHRCGARPGSLTPVDHQFLSSRKKEKRHVKETSCSTCDERPRADWHSYSRSASCQRRGCRSKYDDSVHNTRVLGLHGAAGEEPDPSRCVRRSRWVDPRVIGRKWRPRRPRRWPDQREPRPRTRRVRWWPGQWHDPRLQWWWGSAEYCDQPACWGPGWRRV